MYAQVEKAKENKNRAVANAVGQRKSNVKQGFGFVDNRPEVVAQRKLNSMLNDRHYEMQLKNIQKFTDNAVVQKKGGGEKRKIGEYESDDEANISEGESDTLTRAKKRQKIDVKSQTPFSSAEKSRTVIREFRDQKGKVLRTDENTKPWLHRMGSTEFEFQPTPNRKDVGVYPVTNKDGEKTRSNAKKYAKLGQELDKKAEDKGISHDDMKKILEQVVKDGAGNLSTKDLQKSCPQLDKETVDTIRETAAVLQLDMARSSTGKAAIEAEVFGGTETTFEAVFGAGGKNPEYGGAKNKKTHGQGGVDYLKKFNRENTNRS